MKPIAAELLEVLACPACKSRVLQEGATLKCANGKCALVYPVRDGIPVMLVDQARRPGPAR
jgi:uncharacterized protein YbaR (Trm112 family)